MPDIIIHGASGFLGKHFIKKLMTEKIPVVVLARESSDLSLILNNPGVKIYRYNKSFNELTKIDIKVESPVYFEFSWQGVFGSDRNNEEQMSVNVPLITSSVKFANDLKAKHWIGIGSQAEYGNIDKRISENDVCNPTTLYGKAKLKCSQISAELCNEFQMDHSWLRLFSVYGPDDNHEWLIQYLIKDMLHNKDINVTKGEQLWDYLYIDDISDMFIKLKNASGAGVANLGSGKSVTVKYIIEMIKELTNSKSKINFGAIPYRENQVMKMEADITQLSNHLNWFPKVAMEEGLKRTIDFIKAQTKN